MERNEDPSLPPYNTAIIINDRGDIALHYRKLQPWVPIEPWMPGNMGMPVCDGPKGSKLAVCICHDGMFPELAREAAYKGCNVYIRISGYSTQVNDQWIWTNRTNAWQNLMYTVSVNLAGYDDVFYYFGEVRSAIMTVTSFSRGTATHGKLLPQSCSRAWWIKRVKTGRWKTIFSTLAAGAMSANREANARIT